MRVLNLPLSSSRLEGRHFPAFSAEFSILSAGSRLALLSKVNVPGSPGQFSTSNKRLEPTPQSPHIARPLGFQLGWAAVRNEEWAWPKFGDVRWKLVLLGQPVQLCVSHSLPSSNRCSRRRLQAVSHRLLFRAVPTEPPALEEQPGEPPCVSDSSPRVIPYVSL